MKPGEICWVDLATGRRPGIVVSRESLNQCEAIYALEKGEIDIASG